MKYVQRIYILLMTIHDTFKIIHKYIVRKGKLANDETSCEREVTRFCFIYKRASLSLRLVLTSFK